MTPKQHSAQDEARRLIHEWEDLGIVEQIRHGSDYGDPAIEIIKELLEQVEALETTLAHAEAFIEHMDMSYRWAEWWCEGRDPKQLETLRVLLKQALDENIAFRAALELIRDKRDEEGNLITGREAEAIAFAALSTPAFVPACRRYGAHTGPVVDGVCQTCGESIPAKDES